MWNVRALRFWAYFCTILLSTVSGAAWATTPTACQSSDVPLSVTNATFNSSYCTYSTSLLQGKGWYCDLEVACPNGSSTAIMIWYSGDQWVSWADCNNNGTIDVCSVLPRTETGGQPDTEALYLVGQPTDNILRFSYGTDDLQPVPGSGDTISAWMHSLADTDTLHGSRAASNYSENLYGGDGGDTIYGYDDDDHLYGNGDGDFIYGGPNDDTIDGGGGADWIEGDEGNDLIYGGAAADTIHGGVGNDRIDPGSGNDIVCGDTYVSTACIDNGMSDGTDEIKASDGDDVIDGNGNFDKICDYDGDSLNGSSGDDEIHVNNSGVSWLDCGADVTDDYSNIAGQGGRCEVYLSACTVSGGW